MELLNPFSAARAALFEESIVSANCLSSDTIGRAVFISGDDISGVFQVETMDPQDGSKVPAIGIIISKSSPTDCQVQLFGQMKGIVTGLTPGKAIFVALDGSLSHSPPAPVLTIAYVQPIGIAMADDTVFVSPSLSITKRVA
jgi:hypothetical protein